MATWQLIYSDKALKHLRKLDTHTAQIIVAWLDKNINGCDNPRVHGKGLVSNLSGQWRYRIGDYRILCDIQDNELVVLALEVGHRRSVYK